MGKRVFDPAWVESVKQRYERLPSYQKPVIYSIAVERSRQELRSEIEAWFGQLSQIAQESLLPRLRSSENIQQAYNELAIGHALKQMGHELEHEKCIEGFTPDWFIHPQGTVPEFVVEGFTSNPPEDRVAELKKLDYLYGRLQEIPVGVTLLIRADGSTEMPDSHGSKKIKNAIEQWLTSGAPVVGGRITSDGYTFEVVQQNSSNPRVLCIGPPNLPANTFWVNANSLRKGIETKVRRYKYLGSKGIPLVIGVVPDFYSGLGYDDLEKVLFGEEAIEVTYERATGSVVGQRAIRQDNGLLKQIDPALSAVLRVAKEASMWKVQAIHNPEALNPLPSTTFQ